MLGVGTGAVAADHTLTLIFDSDDEQIIDNSLTQNTMQSKQKRLSEIVEDYFNEGGQTPNNVPAGKKASKFASGNKSGIGGSQTEDVFNVK